MVKKQLRYSFLGIYEIWDCEGFEDCFLYKLFGITIAKRWKYSTTPQHKSRIFWKKYK